MAGNSPKAKGGYVSPMRSNSILEPIPERIHTKSPKHDNSPTSKKGNNLITPQLARAGSILVSENAAFLRSGGLNLRSPRMKQAALNLGFYPKELIQR